MEHRQRTPDTVLVTTKATTPDSIKVKPKPLKTYEIIIASFGLKNEAEHAAKAYRKKGIDATVVADTKKPKYKVSIGSFATRTAANKENRRVQQELSKDAWILTVNNNLE